MLDNKILINLYVLSLGTTFEIFVPINEKVGNIKKLLSSSLFESYKEKAIFVNAETGNVYRNNDVIRNTDIKNDTKLLLV